MKDIVERTFLKGLLTLIFISLLLTGCSTSEKDDKTIQQAEPLTGQALADAYSAQPGNHLEIKKIQSLTTIDVKNSLFVEGTVEETCSEVNVELIDFFGRILGEKKLPVNEGAFVGEITLEERPFSSVYLKVSQPEKTEPIYLRPIPFPIENLNMVHINSPGALETIDSFEFVLEGYVEPYLLAKTDQLIYQVDEGHVYLSEGKIKLDKEGKFSTRINLKEIDRDFVCLGLTLYIFEDEKHPENKFGEVCRHFFYYVKPGSEIPAGLPRAEPKKTDSPEENLHDADVHLHRLETELKCYKDFADFFMDMIDREDLKEYALTLWDYSLFIGEPFKDWEPFPLHGEAEVASSDFKILLREEQPSYPVLPQEIFQSGRISEIGEYGRFFEHLEITSSFPYELQGAAGTVVDNAIYEFKDVPKGAEIEITVTPELQERLGLETANLRVKIK